MARATSCPKPSRPRSPPVKPLTLIALFSVGLASSLATAGLLVRPDRMLVEHVRFVGADRAGAWELRHLLDLPNGTRMWEVDEDQLAAKAASHPWVRAARVHRRWPDEVVIEVEEREVVALVHADRMLVVDRDGTPFLPASSGQLDFPHITGITPEVQQLHPDLARMAVRDALWLIEQLEERGLATLPVSEVAFSATRGFTVFHGQARIVFGHGDLPRQLGRLERLAREQGVDLTGPTLVDLAPSTVAIVRPLHPSDARPPGAAHGS